MNQRKSLNKKRERRVARVRAKILGTREKPRLAVFRSNKNISVQLIDDEKGHTLAHVSGKAVSSKGKSGTKTEQARRAGELLFGKAKELGVKSAVFDRRHYRYHGRIKALVDGARRAGLKI